MHPARLAVTVLIFLVFFLSYPVSARAETAMERAIRSTVSVLPKWPGYAQGGAPQIPPGSAPEGTAVVWRADGFLATALHVVRKAEGIKVRLSDGRVFDAALAAGDPATDLALLKVELPSGVTLPAFDTADPPGLAEPVCAIGNAFGFDLSITCGVVSANNVAGAGFNPIEDFIQTDAALNPGSSGGALVDREGRLVGLLSAIVTKGSDANVGVNFAVSSRLLVRVIDDLMEYGEVRRAGIGVIFEDLELNERESGAGARIARLRSNGPAAAAGLVEGDIVTRIGGRAVRGRAAAMAAVYLLEPGTAATLAVRRGGAETAIELTPTTIGQ